MFSSFHLMSTDVRRYTQSPVQYMHATSHKRSVAVLGSLKLGVGAGLGLTQPLRLEVGPLNSTTESWGALNLSQQGLEWRLIPS